MAGSKIESKESEVGGGNPSGAAPAAKVQTFAAPAAAAVESAKKSKDSETAAEAAKAAWKFLLAAMANAKAKDKRQGYLFPKPNPFFFQSLKSLACET